MTKLIMSSFVFLLMAGAAQAESKVIKECNADIYLGEGRSKDIHTSMKILSDAKGILSAEVDNRVDGVSTVLQEKEVGVLEVAIREGLTKDLETDELDLNDGELIIVHAMSVTSEPIMKWSAGVDLSKVRSVKLFRIGESTKFGSVTIVEAKDKNGVILGSFIGGLIVAACK